MLFLVAHTGQRFKKKKTKNSFPNKSPRWISSFFVLTLLVHTSHFFWLTHTCNQQQQVAMINYGCLCPYLETQPHPPPQPLRATYLDGEKQPRTPGSFPVDHSLLVLLLVLLLLEGNINLAAMAPGRCCSSRCCC